MFPSPIGELHFSIQERYLKAHTQGVSVPYRGATFLNRIAQTVTSMDSVFPSPIGELHFSIESDHQIYFLPQFPSPIGELHFSIVQSKDALAFIIHVSVPYRGATFLNLINILKLLHQEQFPSPIGELHFSIVLYLLVVKLVITFPSPIGELHFSIPSPQPHVLSGTNRGIAGEK